MSESWDIPQWPDPWEPEYEVPALFALAQEVQAMSSVVRCEPDFATIGCAFVQFYRSDVNVGRACVARHATGQPFYSAYFGATGDEFHGFNVRAIASLVGNYETSIDDAPDLDLQFE